MLHVVIITVAKRPKYAMQHAKTMLFSLFDICNKSTFKVIEK